MRPARTRSEEKARSITAVPRWITIPRASDLRHLLCHLATLAFFLYEPSYAQFVFSLPNQLVWVLSRVDSCPTDEYLRLSSTFWPARGATAIPSVHQKKGIMRRRRGCCNASDLPPMIENLGVDIPWSRSSDVHSDMQPGAAEHEHVQT